MPSLPFVQPPAAVKTRRLGNEASGILEMPVLGGMTVGESSQITTALLGEQSAFVKAAQIADLIAQGEGISLSEAFAVIEEAIAGEPAEGEAKRIRDAYAEQIQAVARIYTLSGQANMEATVTAMIVCRCGLDDWTVKDTRKMNPALFRDIWELAKEEQKAEASPSAPPSEEELGKRQPASGSGTKRTGRKSSGN